jgi:hypothetical protein
MQHPSTTLSSLSRAVIESHKSRGKMWLAYLIGFFLLTATMAVVGEASESCKWWLFGAFGLLTILSGYQCWFHFRKPLNDPLLRIARERPESIVRLYVSHTKWKTTAGVHVGDEQYIVFIDDRGSKYKVRVPSLLGSLITNDVARLFPKARLGYESDRPKYGEARSRVGHLISFLFYGVGSFGLLVVIACFALKEGSLQMPIDFKGWLCALFVGLWLAYSFFSGWSNLTCFIKHPAWKRKS